MPIIRPTTPEEADERLKNAFINQDFGLLGGEVESYPIPDRKALLFSSATSAWAERLLNAPVNPYHYGWQGQKDGLVRSYFGDKEAKDVSDEDLFTRIADDYRAQDTLAEAARNAAARGESWLGKYREVEQTLPSLPKGREAFYMGMTRQAYEAFRAKVAPYQSTIKSVAEKARNIETSPDGMDWSGMAQELIQIPKEDRAFVLEAISRQATANIDANSAQRLAKEFSRGFERFLDTAVSGGAGMLLEGIIPASDEPKSREELQIEAQESEQFAQFQDLRDDIRDIATGKLAKLDEVRGPLGMSISGTVRNLPMAIGAFVPYAGPAAMLGSFQRETANELRRTNPTMNRADVEQIATIAAPFQAITEVISDRLLFGKLPNLKKLFTTPVFSPGGVAAQMASRAALGTSTEFAEELTQGVIPRVIQSLKADVPSVDWEGYFQDFKDQSPELLATIIPMALFGAGVGQISDYRASVQMLYSADEMMAAKIPQDEATKIANEAKSGDLKKAETMFKESFRKAAAKGEPPSEMREAALRVVNSIKAQEYTESMNAKEAANLGVRVFRDAESWKVEMGDGNVVKADSAEAARRMRDDIRMASTEYEAETMTALVDDIINLRPQTRVEIRPEIAMATDEGIQFVDPITNKVTKINNAQSFQNLRNQAAAIDGDNRQDLAQSARLILGDNYVEFGESVARVFRSSRGKSDSVPAAITAGHEVIESSFRRGLASGLWTEQDARNAIGSLLPALEAGIQRLGKKASEWEKDWLENAKKAVATGDSILIRETISEMGVRAWIGRDRDGNKTGLRPGAILRALDAAILQEQKPENVTTYQRIRAWFKAVGAYLKGVVATAKIIRDAERNGTIEDFTAFLDKVLGLEAATREENEVKDAVKEMAFSLVPSRTAQDAEYLAAVAAGDMEKAQRMVDEAAKAAGYANESMLSEEEVRQWEAKKQELQRKINVATNNIKAATSSLANAQTQGALRRITESSLARNAANKKSYEEEIKAGPDPITLFHGRSSKWSEYRRNVTGRSIWATNDKDVAKTYGPISTALYMRMRNPMVFDAGGVSFKNLSFEGERLDADDLSQIAEDRGYDGLIIRDFLDSNDDSGGAILADHYTVFDPNQIKSADPVTYDDAGNVIPLSQRFQSESPDIRFSLSPTAGIDVVSDTLESWQGVFDAAARRNPTRAMAIREKGLRDLAKLADSYTQDRWTAKGDKIRALVEKRTKKSLDDEQAMREALRYQELMDDGMMKLTPDVLMAWSEGVGTLQDDPLIFKMLNDYGRLMSKATAEQKGLPIKDLYDDAVWLPPQFYAKNAGIMPDVMANNLGFDTASEMWAALESSIKSHRSAKEGYAKAEAAVKAVDKQAREQAKAEAAAWRKEADDMQAEDWSTRESLVRDMRTLNIILSAFPPEVRAKVTGGSMVKLAGLATERARYKAINTALQKAMEETEKFMRKEYTALVDDMLDVYRSQKDDSGRISGKLPSQYTELIDYAYRIREMDIEAQATEGDGLEKSLEKSESDEETQRILTKLGIVRLFEVWDTKDSVAMGAASDWLSGIIESGKLGRKLLDEDRKAMLDEFRGIAKKDALPEGEISRVDVANEANNVRFKVFRRAWQELNGALDSALHTMAQRLELVFGENSKVADYFTTRLIQAANDSTDIKREINRSYHDILSVVFNTRSRLGHARAIGAMQKVKVSGIMLTEGRVVEEVKLDIETLTKLSDGTMTAEAAGLRQDQVENALNQWATSNRKRTVTVEVVKNAGTQKERQMTELQGIQWWLWSRQDDSRKQMERDGWTEESFKQLEEFLSPEAKALGQWIASSYDQAARMIDPVYRRLFNAPLPRVKNYAPIYRVRSGDASVMDLDASDISSGLSAGFTKSRVNTVSPLAEMDAITVMLTHWENVAHWVTHAEVVRDAKAILLDRDVQTAIKQKSGKVSADSIKARVAAIESQGTNAARELVDLSRWWRRIMQYQAFKGLAYRISPVVKQTSALLNPLLADIPAHSYAVGLARAFYEPIAFYRDVSGMLKSDTIMRRVEGGFSAEARIAMQGEGAAGSVALAWMQRGMMPMAWTDAGWTALGAAISYDYYRRGYMAENPAAPAAMADAYATKQLEKMIAKSAQPSDIVNRSLVEASSNPFMRSLWMFASDQRKALGIEVTALKKLLSGKSKNKALDIQRILVAHFAQAAVTQLMASILASFIGDEEDKEREWSREQWALSLAIGPINGLFVFGRFIDMAGRRLLGLRVFPGGTVVERVGNDVVKGATAVDELFNPEDPEEFIDAMNKVTAGASGVMSMAIGPQAGVADVTANLLREGQKVMDAASED